MYIVHNARDPVRILDVCIFGITYSLTKTLNLKSISLAMGSLTLSEKNP